MAGKYLTPEQCYRSGIAFREDIRMTHREIAQTIGIPESTVKTLHRRALAKMRNYATIIKEAE